MISLFIHLPSGESHKLKVPSNYGRTVLNIAECLRADLQKTGVMFFEVDNDKLELIKLEWLIVPREVLLRSTFSIREIEG